MKTVIHVLFWIAVIITNVMLAHQLLRSPLPDHDSRRDAAEQAAVNLLLTP